RRCKDGRLIDVFVTVSPIRDASGRVIGLSKVDRDITERRLAERAIRESERRLATRVGDLPGMVYRYLAGADWPAELVSDGVRAIVGHDPQDFTSGRIAWFRLIHREDVERVRATIDAGIAEQRPYQSEYRVVHRDGSERWVWERGEPIIVDGELLALEGFVTDVTQRKHAEQALQTALARERSY